jgi:hypothetical protein
LEDRVVPTTFTVMNANDSGTGSLRDAMTQANATPGADTINFDPTFFGTARTITLASILPYITDDLTITGPGANLLTVNAAGVGRLFRQDASNLSIAGLTLTGGMTTTSFGGAILVNVVGNLTVKQTWIVGNSCVGSGGGICCYYGGSLLLDGSTVSGNSAGSFGFGGGGVFFGGAANANGVVIQNTTIVGNTASGGTAYPDGGGGGIELGIQSGAVTIRNCTITGNTLTGGFGGGLDGGTSSGPFSIVSTIISGNTATAGGPDFVDASTGPAAPVLTYDAIGVQTGYVGLQTVYTVGAGSGNNLSAANSTLAALNLRPLLNYGGPTPSLIPGAGSTAIDAGANPAGLTVDQRGLPRVYGAAADIGAVEVSPADPPHVSAMANATLVSGGSATQFTVTYQDAAGIDVSSIIGNNAAVQVTGSGGYSQFATYVGIDNASNGPTRTATYTVPAPSSGAFTGVYSVTLAANQVMDTNGVAVVAGPIGTFVVPQTFTVTSLADSGPGTLRDAITTANAQAPTVDTIDFSPSLFAGGPATITPATALPFVTDGLTIAGPGSGLLNLQSSLVTNVPGTTPVSVSGLTMSGFGVASASGGVETLTDVVLHGSGLGVNGGQVTFRNGRIVGNFGTSPAAGGIKVNAGGSLIVDNSTISGNSTSGNGGGIRVAAGGSLLVKNSTISGNTGHNGGGIYVGGGAGGVTIQNCTVAGNTATSGGGIGLLNVTGTVLVQNSTISGNTAIYTTPSAGYGGGGIDIQATAVVTNLVLQSTIVAGNTQGGLAPAPDLSATPNAVSQITADHCLIGVADTVTYAASNGNIFGRLGSPLNPLLGPLANNGGLNQTMLPQPGSPAFDRGSNPANLTADAAGNPRTNGIAPDIGAVEETSPGLPVAVMGSAPAVTTAGGTSYQFTVTYQGVNAISVASLGAGNVLVTTQNGFSAPAQLVGVDSPTDGSPRTATYAFTPPGGTWDPTDDGTYDVWVQANQVFDTAGNAVPVSLIGMVQVGVAQTFTVTSLADAGLGTLRDAITKANAAAGTADTIQFDPSLFVSGPGVVSLMTALPTITDSLAITGPGSGLLTIRRDPAAAAAFPVLTANGPGGLAINLSGFTVSGGSTTSNGGGLNLTDEFSTLTDVTVAGNTAGSGGGISSNGALTVRNSTIVGNVANSTASSADGGGGVLITTPGVLMLDGCTIAANTGTAAGGVSGSTAGNGTGYPITIRNSTLANNLAYLYLGGGLWMNAFGPYPLLIQNSTITSNTSASYGGAGVSVFMNQSPSITVQSSIIAGNVTPLGTVAGIGPDLYLAQSPSASQPPLVTADHCLIGAADGLTFAAGSANNLTGTIAAPLDPKLGPLGNNGGLVQSCAPHLGSPAIDAGSNPANLTTDERGAARVQGAAAEIGAVERTPGVPDAVAGPLPPVTTAGGTSYQFTVAYSDDVAINAASFGSANIRLTGPGGFSQLAQFVSGDTGAGPVRTATYAITPPGGAWQPGAFGTFTISVEPNQVFNTAGTAVPPMPVGSFHVGVPLIFTVTSLADGGPGTLRQAILDADAAPSPDVIQFDPALFASGPRAINLLSALPAVTDDLTITGPGANELTVNNGTVSVADNRFRTVIVSGLTLKGIFAGTGAFTLLDSAVVGGGIQVDAAGSLAVKRSSITGARQSNSYDYGGGITFIQGGSLDLEDSLIANNSTAASGGGIFFYGAVGSGGFTIRNSTIANNTAAGAGGALATTYTSGRFLIQNSTITNNVAQTTAANTGGGISGLYASSGTVVIQSTIIAGNSAANYPDLSPTLGTSATIDHSLIGSLPSGFVFGAGSGSNLTGTVASPLNPLLAPLGNYGGPTPTCAFWVGSPALNAGSNPAGLAADQRGVSRAIGTAPDIGAYEYVPITVAGVQVNDGLAQRSEVRSLTVTFSGLVSFAGGNANAAAAFHLIHVQTGNLVNLATAVSNIAGHTVVTLTFLPTNANGDDTDPVSATNGGQLSLADGRYQLIVLGAAVSDAAFGWLSDGNGDGVPGGDYQSPADAPGGGGLHLYRLFADVTGDGVVDLSDLAAFRSAYNTAAGVPGYLAYLDADNSGAIDLTDLTEFRNRYNHSVFV